MAYVISDDCIACGTCIDECPVGAISEGDKYSIQSSIYDNEFRLLQLGVAFFYVLLWSWSYRWNIKIEAVSN